MSISSSCFPLHLISDILLRLPAESVVRARYVSKLWSSITTDPYFTNKFETQCSTRPSLLMLFEKRGKLFVFSFPQQNQNSKESCSSQHVESYQTKYPKNCSFSFTESVHGLICIGNQTNPIIWNPSMRKFLTLRKPDKKWKDLRVFLGYDPIEGKHKVMCMPVTAEACDECRVLTLGSRKKSWRVIKTNHMHRTYSDSYGRCINGVVYYHAYTDDWYDDYMIMSFDVRTEKFRMIKVPPDDFFGSLIAYEGRLARVDTMDDTNGISLWILEDTEKHKWSCKYYFSSFVRSLKFFYRIEGATDTGEFICVPRTFLKSFFFCYFDPVRNTLRKVEYKGIADDTFRFSNGLGSKRLGPLQILPNHIETLMSL